MNTEQTRVIFRKWSNGDILALFPDIQDWEYVMSYEHVGQHGNADYDGCIGQTKPATPDEYQSLAAELTAIGYDLQVRKRR